MTKRGPREITAKPQISWGSNIAVGQELPELVKHPTTRQLVQYAGAQGDFYEIHYDQAYAQGVGLPGVILHGLLKAAFLGQLVTDWLGDQGTLKAFEVSYRGVDMPAHPYRCRGRVTKVTGNDLELEVWGEDETGKRSTIGTAAVQLG
jgi:acyl dehydratase